MSLPSPKVRRCSPSPHSIKSGPLKATLPVSSLVKADDNVNKCKSSSPTTALHKRYSPDVPASGNRSPGAFSYYKGKGKDGVGVAGGLSSSIRRTASMDAIYLKGRWPTEAFYMHGAMLQLDKATQTDEGWSEKRSRTSEGDDGKLEKYLRHRLRTGRLGLRLISPPAVPMSDHTPTDGVASGGGWIMSSPTRGSYRGPLRGSLEGLNQEIQTLVLKDFDDNTVTCGSVPEGHKAPLLELLRPTRSVNTQTPGSTGEDGMDVSWTSGPPSRGSMSPQYYMLPCRNESCGSSPDEGTRPGTSPHINCFLAREPPDGCERVNLRVEDVKKSSAAQLLTPLNPKPSMFKPSLGSAFHPLHSQQSTLLKGQCCEGERESDKDDVKND